MDNPTTEAEYRQHPGLNYSKLSQFYESQDHALLQTPPKAIFEIGHIFEDMVQDACKGTSLFKDRYFVCDTKGKMPDELMRWIESCEDLSTKIIYNKDGVTPSGHHKSRHAFIDACLDNPGKYPITQYDSDMLCIMRDNMLSTEVFGSTVLEMLADSEFQIPVTWETHGILKKALFDAVYVDSDYVISFDIKTSANQTTFNRFAREKYWIQKEHYSEGAVHEWGRINGFCFLAGYKEDPFLCEPIQIKGDKSYDYEALCNDYMKWAREDKPQKGYLPMRDIWVGQGGYYA
jgi:hypothetical protein